jgi:plasmid stability protein
MRYDECMRHLTIRNIPEELGERLAEEKRASGRSLNQTVVDLLAQALGVAPHGRRSNGLAALAGTWGPGELEEFERAIGFTEEIDDELWS